MWVVVVPVATAFTASPAEHSLSQARRAHCFECALSFTETPEVNRCNHLKSEKSSSSNRVTDLAHGGARITVQFCLTPELGPLTLHRRTPQGYEMADFGPNEDFGPEFHPGCGFSSLSKAVALTLGFHIAGPSASSAVVEVPDLGFD